MERCRKSCPPPGLDPWTVHPVGGRYTDWATRPMEGDFKKIKKLQKEKGKVGNIYKEQEEGICGRKKYGKLGLKLCSYHNKVTELPLQYPSPIPQTWRLMTSIFVQRQATISAEQLTPDVIWFISSSSLCQLHRHCTEFVLIISVGKSIAANGMKTEVATHPIG